jgi:hypothetical protein
MTLKQAEEKTYKKLLMKFERQSQSVREFGKNGR